MASPCDPVLTLWAHGDILIDCVETALSTASQWGGLLASVTAVISALSPSSSVEDLLQPAQEYLPENDHPKESVPPRVALEAKGSWRMLPTTLSLSLFSRAGDLEVTVIAIPCIYRALSLGFQFNSTNICYVPRM